MSDPEFDPASRYRVSYSERVRIELRKLGAVAIHRKMGARFLAALKEIDDRLHIYPQFGEPLSDLTVTPLQSWIGTIPPLTVRYFLDEEQRLVIVSVPLKPLPRSGLE